MMSETMQIDIRLLPFYEKPFERHFPKLAALLKEHDYTRPFEKEITLYELVEYLVDVTQEPRIPDDVKDRIGERVKDLVRIKEEARAHLLGRRLNRLDQSLYRLEDAYRELERGL
jgi:hypothetical protein